LFSSRRLTSRFDAPLGISVLTIQAVLIAIVSGATFFIGGPLFSISAVWGGLCSLANVSLLIWRQRSDCNPEFEAARHLRLMYRSALERFVVVIGLLAFGVLRLKLMPFEILLGFVSGQVGLTLAYLIIGMRKKS
jgi:hypothetical protein